MPPYCGGLGEWSLERTPQVLIPSAHWGQSTLGSAESFTQAQTAPTMVEDSRGHNRPSVSSSVCRVLGQGPALSCHEGSRGRTQEGMKTESAGLPGLFREGGIHTLPTSLVDMGGLLSFSTVMNGVRWERTVLRPRLETKIKVRKPERSQSPMIAAEIILRPWRLGMSASPQIYYVSG